MADQQGFLVTARKWRPLRFSDVVGQEHITTTLRNAIRSSRIHHAYLFTGPRGVGKTTCARILARALNCPNAVDAEPCNACPACTDMMDGRSVDVIEIDGASNNSVDDIRTLRDNARYAPVVGRRKMYIIDEVHMLSTAAFNALLKTLEEPPPHLVFVFATTEIHKVPATILSRCQRFDFRRMEVETIVEQLRHITTAEGIAADDASLVAIARKADGSMRDSQSIFDQVVSFCGRDIRYTDVAAALHLIDVDFFFALGEAVHRHDVAAMFTHARNVVVRGYDLQECLLGLLEHFRNILTVIATGTTSLIEASASYLERYRQEAERFTKADTLRIMAMITQGEAVLRTNPPQPRIRFEATLVQLAAMDSTVDLGRVLATLEGGASQPVRPPLPAPTPVATTPPAAEAGTPPTATAAPRLIPVAVRRSSATVRSSPPVNSLTAGTLAGRWSAFVDQAPETLAVLVGAVRQGGGFLQVDFADIGITLRPQADVIHDRLEDTLPAIHTALATFYGAAVAVRLVKPPVRQAPPPPSTTGDQPTVAAADDEGMLPIEQDIVELFKARRVVVPGSPS